MPNYKNIIESKKYTFVDTSFDQLIQHRIHKVLLVCNSYDAFMLEEDGRIDERIFNEYFSQNLRHPPTFLQAHTVVKAFNLLEEESIDLVITMLTVEDLDAFKLARRIKNLYPKKPIVVLTPFSREVSMWLEKEDNSAIDYVFCWLGNADILLAIIKLIEDRMNLKHDVEESGVQAILLIEDSVRYYSSYLPIIYKIIFQQSKMSMSEGLNEHQRMLLMRGRPKILLATTYEEAESLFDKYKTNLIGVISDMAYKLKGIKDFKAGVKFYWKVHEEDCFMPYLLQSSDAENERVAREMGVDFINKYSKTLSIELSNYIVHNLAFGDFIFRNAKTGEEIDRATDLKSLQEKILKISDETLEYHVKQNHFSKWFNARALFSIARMLKYITYDDFNNIGEVRSFIYDVVTTYRQYRGKGVIAKFNRKSFDEYLNFSRIGDGSIGGKARGLAFIDLILKKYELSEKWEGVKVKIPRSVVLSCDVFDEFMESNKLNRVTLKAVTDDEILHAFVDASLPWKVINEIKAFISSTTGPIAVRSSSKLEDSHYQPFAGIYSTYMVPNVKKNRKLTLKFLIEAVKSVYASVFYKSSKAYMTVTSNMIDEEKMAIILQEVCGKQYGDVFYPVISGVARSINFYPIAPEKPEDGFVSLAFGLGKYIVDGGQALRFSPKYPKKILQLSSPSMALRETQKYFYALNLKNDSFKPSVDEGVNIDKLPVKNAENETSFEHVASTYDFENNLLRDGFHEGGLKVVSFSNILQYNVFPLAEILIHLLDICQQEMGNPIEIEFAVDIDVPAGQPRVFNFLQIRPIVENKEIVVLDLENEEKEKTIVISKSALGNGIINNVFDVLYVKPGSFNPAKSHDIAKAIEKVNNIFLKNNQNYVLIGPGRWGSSDPWLGIPVKWPQISSACLIIESGLENFRIDPSQGTHFFQNLTSFRVGYFTINPYINDGYYDVDFLSAHPSVYEDEYLRHVKFNNPLTIKIDGKNNRGIIYKPGEI